VRTTPAKLIHEYRVFRDGTLLAIGRTVLACINQQGQVQRITRELLFGSAS
jgi:acyl-CoA thioester hydrolase